MGKSASNGPTQTDCGGRTDAFPAHMWARNAVGRTATTVVGCPRMSVPGPQVSESKIPATAAQHKKLPTTISLQTTATLLYPYTSSPRRRPRPVVAYRRSSPQPRSTVLEPSSLAWRAR
jgi:hypothetical protein